MAEYRLEGMPATVSRKLIHVGARQKDECMGVLWGVDHFKPYLSGRRFKLIVDCSALTWLFRSRDLCPKLHRWSLRLMEYDMDLVWKEGAQDVLPDALSRLPHAPYPQGDVDDSFPDDPSSSSPFSVRWSARASLRRNPARSH